MPRRTAPGRVCTVCKDRQPYENFRKDSGGLGRICRLCRAVDAHADDVTCVCSICGKDFTAHHKTARYCGHDCRNVAQGRKIRHARRLAKARKKLAASIPSAPSRARANLDHA